VYPFAVMGKIEIQDGAGQIWGPYGVEQTRQLLAEGKFHPNNLARFAGEAEWRPLQMVLDPGSVAGNSAPTKKGGQKLFIAGLICMVLGLVLCVIPLLFLLGIPLLFVAFLLFIIAIVKGSRAPAIICLVITIVLGFMAVSIGAIFTLQALGTKVTRVFVTVQTKVIDDELIEFPDDAEIKQNAIDSYENILISLHDISPTTPEIDAQIWAVEQKLKALKADDREGYLRTFEEWKEMYPGGSSSP